jgi:retron-type reverse transcriptase
MEPDPELKARQRSILHWLMARRIRPSKYAHGFIKKRSTVTNAGQHVGKGVVVRLDIKNFFPSISQRQVEYALTREGVSLKNAQVIAELCTVDGRLPQGAPTSPFLSNVVFKALDYRLAGLAKSWEASYSRYADDLVFSSDRKNLNHIYHPVRKILEDERFRIHSDKFRVYRSTRRQLVTGIVVNKRLNLPRQERRALRAAIHNTREDVVNGREVPPSRLQVLEGKAAYLAGIVPEQGKRVLQAVRDVKALLELRNRMTVAH